MVHCRCDILMQSWCSPSSSSCNQKQKNKQTFFFCCLFAAHYLFFFKLLFMFYKSSPLTQCWFCHLRSGPEILRCASIWLEEDAAAAAALRLEIRIFTVGCYIGMYTVWQRAFIFGEEELRRQVIALVLSKNGCRRGIKRLPVSASTFSCSTSSQKNRIFLQDPVCHSMFSVIKKTYLKVC